MLVTMWRNQGHNQKREDSEEVVHEQVLELFKKDKSDMEKDHGR
jgi:hypothetical protein